MADDRLAAKGVYKGGSAYTMVKGFVSNSGTLCCRGMPEIRAHLNLPVPDAPQTIKQNWIPFFTFFLRRIIFCRLNIGLAGRSKRINGTARCDRLLELMVVEVLMLLMLLFVVDCKVDGTPD